MAKSFRELVAWQLAVELRDKVLPLLKTDPVRKDFKFCDQLADSVRSALPTVVMNPRVEPLC